MNFDLELYRQIWQRLNRSKIINSLANNLEPLPLHVFESLPSTNTKAWELINENAKMPIAAIALEQTAGKGQWSNSWVSAKGGLYLSVALEVDLYLNNYPHLVMATAWGIAKVLRYYQLPVTIKWFNDLILDKGKLGGIKIETRNVRKKISQAVVGVGINWHNSVPKPGINLNSYYADKTSVIIDSLEELTAVTSYGIILGYQYYLSQGIEKLVAEYTAILNSIGRQITINNYSGKIIGVDQDGKLQVKTQSSGTNAIVIFAPGEISLGY